MIQVVDLASKQSAVLLRDRGTGEVHDQFDSIGLSSFDLARRVGVNARRKDVELTVIEDVPYGISSQAQVKPVLRLQGIFIAVLHPALDRTLFLDPSRWMSMFPGVQRAPKGLTKTEADKARIEAARLHALERGYEPPNLVQRYIDSLPAGTKVLKKHTAPLEKSMTDYVSAFLMSEFIRSMSEEDFRALQGVSPAYI
jgi:hypothetical protein